MTAIPDHARTYWQYEYDVSARYMIPLMESWGVALRGAQVLDVGCGEGGGVCSLVDAGARCMGYDINSERVALANVLKGTRQVTMTTGNLYIDPMPFDGMRFDLVVLHDVFEHLENKLPTMERLVRYLNNNGKLLITFPPYYSAYGAHQQLLRSQIARMPFFHLVPFSLSYGLPRLKGEEPVFVEEVQKLGRLRMGMGGFERIVRSAGLRIVGRQAYLIGPNHIRFGLSPVPAGVLARIPGLREILCTGVVYLLGRP
jgi:SAM-dependent methyltransferase